MNLPNCIRCLICYVLCAICFSHSVAAPLIVQPGATSFMTLSPPYTNPSPEPINGSIYTDIYAGANHTCGVKKDGSVWCWGSNSYQQIGNGNATVRSTTPTRVFATGVQQVSGGQFHTCAIANGQPYCWGHNNYAQLADGVNLSDKPIPTRLQALQNVNVSQIIGGVYHTCALLNGEVRCWGFNNDGQLGNGNFSSISNPTRVLNLTNVSQIAAHYHHSCAIQAGSVWCWGYARYVWNTNNRPQLKEHFTNIKQIALGREHVCALGTNSNVRCWGRNDRGQLANGISQTTTNTFATPNPTLRNVAQVAAGMYHTCALFTDDRIMCWGNNDSGQLGDGTTTTRGSPVNVNRPEGFQDISKITAGDFHTCAIANGHPWCWGRNSSGQLGDGSFNNQRSVPTKVRVQESN